MKSVHSNGIAAITGGKIERCFHCWPIASHLDNTDLRRVQNRGSYCGLLAMLHHLINLLCQSKYWETHGLQSVMRQGSTVQIRLLNKICEHIINAPWATELTALIFGKFVSLKSFISPLHKCFIEQNEMKMKGREQTEQYRENREKLWGLLWLTSASPPASRQSIIKLWLEVRWI